MFETQEKKKQLGAASCTVKILIRALLFSEQWSMSPLFTEQFFFKKKSMQLVDFTHTVHVNVNNKFF